MKIYSTSDVGTGFVSMLIYGLAGAGKTPLASTLPSPIILTSEPGLLSLRAHKLPYVLARDYAEAREAIMWAATSREAAQFQSIFFDSISALSENILLEKKRKSSDPRKFSPETTAATMEIVLLALGINNKHLVMTSKAVEITDQITSAKTVEPFCVVPKLGPALPYHFDTVLYLSRHRLEDGSEIPALRCRENDFARARDRSGRLDLWEPANLSHIIRKQTGQ